jgi:Polyketide cyclase / dehydrase and lipid transport
MIAWDRHRPGSPGVGAMSQVRVDGMPMRWSPRARSLRPMKITVRAERQIDAPASRVYDLIRDFREHHPRFLPPQFSDFEVETGGVGAGTVHRFRMTLAGRTTDHRVRVGEPEPGRVLIESDASRRMLTTFTVDRELYGGSRVRIESRWYADGLHGLIERLVAPRLLRRVYREELILLDRYARGIRPQARRGPGAGRGAVAFG